MPFFMDLNEVLQSDFNSLHALQFSFISSVWGSMDCPLFSVFVCMRGESSIWQTLHKQDKLLLGALHFRLTGETAHSLLPFNPPLDEGGVSIIYFIIFMAAAIRSPRHSRGTHCARCCANTEQNHGPHPKKFII